MPEATNIDWIVSHLEDALKELHEVSPLMAYTHAISIHGGLAMALKRAKDAQTTERAIAAGARP